MRSSRVLYDDILAGDRRSTWSPEVRRFRVAQDLHCAREEYFLNQSL